MKKSLLIVSLTLLSVVLSGCSVTGGAVKPLMEVGMSGGMCVDGSCDSSYTVYEDGSTDAASAIQVNVEALKSAIADSSLDDLVGDPEAFCQSYVDGQDLTIRVYAWGSDVYKPCEIQDADQDPLTIEAQKIMNEINQMEEATSNER